MNGRERCLSRAMRRQERRLEMEIHDVLMATDFSECAEAEQEVVFEIRAERQCYDLS